MMALMSKIKEYKFLTEQIEVMDSKLRTMSPDDPNYTNTLYYREKYVKARAELEPKIDWGTVAQLGIAGATLFGVWYQCETVKGMALLAYDCDGNMMLPNGKIWNCAQQVLRMTPKV